MLKGIGRAPHHGSREFEAYCARGETVLDRLEPADRLAELGADLGVIDRLRQHRFGQPDKLRRTHQRAEIEQIWIIAGINGCGGQPPQGIDAGQRIAVAIGHPRVYRMPWRERPAPGENVGQAIGLALTDQPRHADQRGIDQRFGQTRAPTFARHQHRIDQPEAQPAMILWNQQPGQAHVDQPLPDRGIASIALIQPAQDVRTVRVGQVFAHGFGQRRLVIADAEVHQPAPTLGSPSRRSAVMLR